MQHHNNEHCLPQTDDLTTEEVARLLQSHEALQTLHDHINSALALDEHASHNDTSAELARLITTLEEQDTRIAQMDEALELSLKDLVQQNETINTLGKQVAIEQTDRASAEMTAMEAVARADAFTKALEITTADRRSSQ